MAGSTLISSDSQEKRKKVCLLLVLDSASPTFNGQREGGREGEGEGERDQSIESDKATEGRIQTLAVVFTFWMGYLAQLPFLSLLVLGARANVFFGLGRGV